MSDVPPPDDLDSTGAPRRLPPEEEADEIARFEQDSAEAHAFEDEARAQTRRDDR